jgi:hypothetical protein
MAEHERQRQERVRAMMRKVRPDAGFFDWPVKPTKEFRVVVHLCDSVGDALGLDSISLGSDPPDVIGHQHEGGDVAGAGTPVAIEVTELVDEEVLAHNVRVHRESQGEDFIERGKPLQRRVWDRPGLIAATDERLRVKDGVTLKPAPCGRQYERYIVVLHTDEMMLVHAEAQEWLRDHTFTGMRQVTEAYLLFSPDGAERPFPHIRLNIAARQSEPTADAPRG